MKNILFILSAFFSLSVIAQDTLYTVKGKIITGQVIEITPHEIKYKRAANPDGPLYVIDKTDIVLIHYKNGSKDVFENSGSTDVSTNNSQNSSENTVTDRRPLVNVVVGTPLHYLTWGALGWGWRWGWNRPYYYGGFRTHHHHWHHRHHGHYGRRGR